MLGKGLLCDVVHTLLKAGWCRFSGGCGSCLVKSVAKNTSLSFLCLLTAWKKPSETNTVCLQSKTYTFKNMLAGVLGHRLYFNVLVLLRESLQVTAMQTTDDPEVLLLNTVRASPSWGMRFFFFCLATGGCRGVAANWLTSPCWLLMHKLNVS